MSKNPQESDLGEFMQYSGELSAVDKVTAVTFRVRIDKSGKIQLDIDPIPFTNDTAYILTHWHGEASEINYFALHGTANDETRFSTQHLYFTTLPITESLEHGSQIRPVGGCSQAKIHRRLLDAVSKPALQMHLKGFQAFESLEANCNLGRVIMLGRKDIEDPNTITGYLAVEAPDNIKDAHAWRELAGKLLAHVRRVMSFASATNLGAPISEFRFDGTLELEAWSQTHQAAAPIPVIHFLNQQPIFEAAIRSFFDPPFVAENLPFAIEWFAMETNQNEIRLINAMTALENLVASNLAESELLIRPKKEFEKSRRVLRGVIGDCVARWVDVDEDARATMLSELNARLTDLNRRSILDKIYSLAKRWAVPLNGISPQQLQGAKRARDLIVHRGHYYEKDNRNEVALWEHITIIRELFVRFFLTAIDYRGSYISYFGGYRHTTFPPTP